MSFAGDLMCSGRPVGSRPFRYRLPALDTGSSFERMEASRKAHFTVMAEPALLLTLLTLARAAGGMSLTAMYGALVPFLWAAALPSLALVAMTLLILELVENSWIPVDNPTTDPYAAALKLWLVGGLVVGARIWNRLHNHRVNTPSGC